MLLVPAFPNVLRWSISKTFVISDTFLISSPDQIALPDFNAGAMENWGLVTYRETALLFDPIMSSNGNKERITTVISHELAHMVGQIAITSVPVLVIRINLTVG